MMSCIDYPSKINSLAPATDEEVLNYVKDYIRTETAFVSALNKIGKKANKEKAKLELYKDAKRLLEFYISNNINAIDKAIEECKQSAEHIEIITNKSPMQAYAEGNDLVGIYSTSTIKKRYYIDYGIDKALYIIEIRKVLINAYNHLSKNYE